MVQLVASMSGAVLGGVAMVVGSSLTRGKIFCILSLSTLFYLLDIKLAQNTKQFWRFV